MSELVTVLEALEAEARTDRPAVFCVILEKSGSAPREPGAAMLVREEGVSNGTVGGGAVEVVAQREAKALLARGNAKLLSLSLDDDHGQDDASICGGAVVVGLVPIRNAEDYRPFEVALSAARRREPAQIPVNVETGGKQLAYQLHVETPPTLVIAGAGHVGQALSRLAGPLDFRVVVIDDRDEVASAERFDKTVELRVGPIAETLRDYPIDPSCYVAIMTRGHRHDLVALEAVIRRPMAYIGVIASRRKRDALLGALADAGVAQELLDQVHIPIGLPIGAMSVNEIAVSIAAELIQVRRKTVPKMVVGPTTAGCS